MHAPFLALRRLLFSAHRPHVCLLPLELWLQRWASLSPLQVLGNREGRQVWYIFLQTYNLLKSDWALVLNVYSPATTSPSLGNLILEMLITSPSPPHTHTCWMGSSGSEAPPSRLTNPSRWLLTQWRLRTNHWCLGMLVTPHLSVQLSPFLCCLHPVSGTSSDLPLRFLVTRSFRFFQEIQRFISASRPEDFKHLGSCQPPSDATLRANAVRRLSNFD